MLVLIDLVNVYKRMILFISRRVGRYRGYTPAMPQACSEKLNPFWLRIDVGPFHLEYGKLSDVFGRLCSLFYILIIIKRDKNK